MMRETFHLVLAVAALGIFLLALVATPRVERAASVGGSVSLLRVARHQQLLSTVEHMYGPGSAQLQVQRRQSLLNTVSEIDRAMGNSEDGYRENRDRIGRVQATGVAQHSLDEGLPTLTSSTIWSRGSPQNQGWSGGDFEAGSSDNTGTGKIKGA
jgi:hypothetical protein